VKTYDEQISQYVLLLYAPYGGTLNYHVQGQGLSYSRFESRLIDKFPWLPHAPISRPKRQHMCCTSTPDNAQLAHRTQYSCCTSDAILLRT
jgi:hypothetical protein